MIDTTSETLLPLAEAANSLPRRRKGRKTHVSTLYRWATAGCRGVRLETVQIGATRCTSREALERFFQRLTNPHQADAVVGSAGSALPTGRSPARRRRDSDRAGRLLEEAGA